MFFIFFFEELPVIGLFLVILRDVRREAALAFPSPPSALRGFLAERSTIRAPFLQV